MSWFSLMVRSSQNCSKKLTLCFHLSQVSVLALSEAMLAAEAEEAIRERGGAEEALKRHRGEQREAEAEYQRVQVSTDSPL